MYVNLKTTNHEFEKQNTVTLQDRDGNYDFYTCRHCGCKGKRYGLSNMLNVDGQQKAKAENCPGASPVKRIRIVNCNAVSAFFANLTPGSIHDVIAPPEGQSNVDGVWVRGVGVPVKVLRFEYTVVTEGDKS